MPSRDAELIRRITQDASRYLNRLQREGLLWADVDGHIAASHIAECMGDVSLVSRHLQTVARLLAEIHLECPRVPHAPKKKRPGAQKRSPSFDLVDAGAKKL